MERTAVLWVLLACHQLRGIVHEAARLFGGSVMPGLGTVSIKRWPAQSRAAAERVIEQYGEPDEVTDGQLIWHKRGPWRQIVASKSLFQHNFPAPHYTLFALEPIEDEILAAKAQLEAGRKSSAKRRIRKAPAASLSKISAADPSMA
jgi:hypothetical protein